MAKDWEYESSLGALTPFAMSLGFQLPEDDDGFWFREDHGPTHDDDLEPFVVAELCDKLNQLASAQSTIARLQSRVEELERAADRLAALTPEERNERE